MSARTIIADMYRSQPLVFGHRGAKAYAPMNTLPAFELAAQQGAHGIELDVHRSRDGHPVVIHDFTVDATTDGTGLVAALSLADLRALDAGSWFGPQFAGVRVPTLDEVFEAVGRRLLVNVEIKAEGEETDGVEEAVAACIRRHDIAERVVVSSFNLPTLRRFRRLMPGVSIGYLYAQVEPTSLDDSAFEAYHPHLSDVSPELVEAARSTGKVINVWTVNDPAHIAALARLGVHGIITDVPDVALEALSSTRCASRAG
jgi:glycerophosphoryl diester phosphodiesterase